MNVEKRVPIKWMLAILISLVAIPGCQRERTPENERFRVGIAYATGGKRDSSYSESAALGISVAKQNLPIEVTEVEPAQLTDLESSLIALARGGNQLVVAVGPFYGEALKRVAPSFPNVKFVAIDAEVQVPSNNVRSVLFREEQGSFLVGALAGLATKNDKVGAVAAMDLPILNKFVSGYRCGALATNPRLRWGREHIREYVEYIGTGPEAFNDPLKGAEHARRLITKGVDVIFQVAGGSGHGVINAARSAKKFSIGVDSNQNSLAPGSVLTSMLKRADLVVLDSIEDMMKGRFDAEVVWLGLQKTGKNYVDYALDSNNEPLILPEWKTTVESFRERVRSGEIVVPTSLDAACPAIKSRP